MKTRKVRKLLAFVLAVSMVVPAAPSLAAQGGDMQDEVEAVNDTYAAGATATLHFDADPANSKSEVLHGSTGFLYGVSEVNVPSADLLGAISPKILVQKAKGGQQHPSGDGYRLTPYLRGCGVENIQIYLQDY